MIPKGLQDLYRFVLDYQFDLDSIYLRGSRVTAFVYGAFDSRKEDQIAFLEDDEIAAYTCRWELS